MTIIPTFGFETLYKSDSPKDFATGEYYQVHFECEIDPATSKELFFVREKHGYFDDRQKRAVHHTTTFAPEEGFATREDAEARYSQQLTQRASEGFVHSFCLDPFEGMKYRDISQKWSENHKKI
jgi:hypothetical protein